jgi:DNA-binding NarL/FixJ family response regulator
MPDKKITIAMADDHVIIRQALAAMIETFGDYEVIIQASNGQDLLNSLGGGIIPELILLDISMPVMNGIETAKRISETYPDIKMLALSMMDDEKSVVGMVRNGVRGYIVKDAEPAQLKDALHDVLHKGFHYSDLVTGRMIHSLQSGKNEKENTHPKLSDREIEFLKLTCTELTYKEIADRLHVSPRTVDGYRDSLFEKLGVKSRVGLCLYVMRIGL